MQDKIIKMIAENIGVRIEEVKLESKLVEGLGYDDIDMTELIMELEEEFNTEIPNGDEENFKTVQDIVDYIQKVKA